MGKKLSRSAPTERYLHQGIETAIRLKLLPECVALVEPLDAATELVRMALEKRITAEQAFIPIRVKCSFANWEWDGTLRAMASSTEAQTGGKKSQAYRELLPNGIGPLVVPVGEGQRAAAQRFLAHLGTCTTPAASAVVEEWRPKLQKAYDALAAALSARTSADTALYVARAEEQAAKRDFNRTIDKTIAQVRATYPEDRARQDLAFPSLEDAGAAAETEVGTEAAESEKVTEPA